MVSELYGGSKAGMGGQWVQKKSLDTTVTVNFVLDSSQQMTCPYIAEPWHHHQSSCGPGRSSPLRHTVGSPGGTQTTEINLDLPAPFFGVSKRLPYGGAPVLTLVDVCKGYDVWQRNTFGHVVDVDYDRREAKVHLACDAVFQLSFSCFVVLSLLEDGSD